MPTSLAALEEVPLPEKGVRQPTYDEYITTTAEELLLVVNSTITANSSQKHGGNLSGDAQTSAGVLTPSPGGLQ